MIRLPLEIIRVTKPLAYDLYVAAELFLYTGRAEQEVLECLGLSPEEWRRIDSCYLQLLHGDHYLPRLAAIWPELDASSLYTALIGPRWRYPDPQPSVSDAVAGIRNAVLRKPHIGPFTDQPWAAVHLMDDPVARLRYYSRDTDRVFFWGKPLADKKGELLTLDAAHFRHLGGRWYTDGEKVLGQGELRGPKIRRYWWTLAGAERDSFEALSLRYARDRAHAWYITGKEIHTRSPAAFEVVPRLRLNWATKLGEPLVADSYVARDGERVYSYGARVHLADPAAFRALGGGYWTDGRYVWFDDGKVLVADADASSFTVPGPTDAPVAGNQGSAATDRERPYELGKPVPQDEVFENWRAFFSIHPDRQEWWWWRLAASR
jgi:hypothetical protein